MAFKYIRNEHHGIIIFPKTLNHADMARALGGRVISAGFAALGIGEEGQAVWYAFGESVSLDMGPDPEDSKLLQQAYSL